MYLLSRATLPLYPPQRPSVRLQGPTQNAVTGGFQPQALSARDIRTSIIARADRPQEL